MLSFFFFEGAVIMILKQTAKIEKPLMTLLVQTINTWIRYESKHDKYEFTKGQMKWWYSPSTGALLPVEDPMKSSERASGILLGVSDWIFLAETVDGEIIVSKEPGYFEIPEDFWLT